MLESENHWCDFFKDKVDTRNLTWVRYFTGFKSNAKSSIYNFHFIIFLLRFSNVSLVLMGIVWVIFEVVTIFNFLSISSHSLNANIDEEIKEVLSYLNSLDDAMNA